jgi:hypothetical protein
LSVAAYAVTMSERVFAAVQELGKARFRLLCERLPYARESISDALDYLKTKGQIRLQRDQFGQYWAVRRRPTSSV